MKKIIYACFICALFNLLQGSAFAADRQVNNPSIMGETFENLSGVNAGGAVYNSIQAEVSNSTFIKNAANSYGGALANWSTGDIKVTSSKFVENKAGAYGGAAFNFNKASFSNNIFDGNKGTLGGAIFNYNGGTLEINGDTFTNNTAVAGGGIFTNSDTTLKVSNASFISNIATQDGGAIMNQGGNIEISSSLFENNSILNGTGGAISTIDYNPLNSVKIDSSTFRGNTALNGSDINYGGAIALNYGNLYVTNSQFFSNAADSAGAIVSMLGANLSVDNSYFENNISYNAGGAVDSYGTLNIVNSTFKDNSVIVDTTTRNAAGGGAVFLGAKSLAKIKNSNFIGNTSTMAGGAIATRNPNWATNEGAKLDIINSYFDSNTAGQDGGAIYNTFYNSDSNAGKTSVIGSVFVNNKAQNGGAIYNESLLDYNSHPGVIYLETCDFISNIAQNEGGAIHTNGTVDILDTNFVQNSASVGGAIFANGDLNISAINRDIAFSHNTASLGADIYQAKNSSTITINAEEGRKISFDGGIYGENYTIQVNTNPTNKGEIVVKAPIYNAGITVSNGGIHLAENNELINSTLHMKSNTALNMIDNRINNYANFISIEDNVKLAVDIDLTTEKGDNLASVSRGSGITIYDINLVGMTKKENVAIPLSEAIGFLPNEADVEASLIGKEYKTMTPVRILSGSVAQDGVLYLSPKGEGYSNFNPAIMSSSVASQLGGYITQLNSYDEAFRNMDFYMMLTKKEREAIKLQNRYASSDTSLIFPPIISPDDEPNIWLRPYTTFERVPLRDGPKVSNVSYGIFFGGESQLYELGNGWDATWSVYGGYNGSHQAYDGVSIYQNGGTLGLVGMAYKGNFFTGLTVNASSSGGRATSIYGDEDFTMLMAGIASKTGYNFEFLDGKIVLQPSCLMSYSFVNTFDYTNAAGIRINTKPINVIQVEPGLKIIGNLKNGWQPYIGVSVIYNIIDKTSFKANDVSLPELSIKPYVKYGIGVQKKWNDRMTGYFQTYFTNGGRNGVGLQAGFSFALGKSPKIRENWAMNSVPVVKSAKLHS